MIPIYHMFLFAISPKEDAFLENCGRRIRRCTISHRVYQEHYFLRDFWIQFWEFDRDRCAAGALTLVIATAAASRSRGSRWRAAAG